MCCQRVILLTAMIVCLELSFVASLDGECSNSKCKPSTNSPTQSEHCSYMICAPVIIRQTIDMEQVSKIVTVVENLKKDNQRLKDILEEIKRRVIKMEDICDKPVTSIQIKPTTKPSKKPPSTPKVTKPAVVQKPQKPIVIKPINPIVIQKPHKPIMIKPIKHVVIHKPHRPVIVKPNKIVHIKPGNVCKNCKKGQNHGSDENHSKQRNSDEDD